MLVKRPVKNGKIAHVFQERSLFCQHLKPQRIMHLRHLYFPLFTTIDIKGLKFLSKCRVSEITTKSNGGFLKCWWNMLPTSQNPWTLSSPVFAYLKKLLNLSLRFLLLGWEPNLKLLLECRHISVVIRIMVLLLDHWRNGLCILYGFSPYCSIVFYWMNGQMNDVAF